MPTATRLEASQLVGTSNMTDEARSIVTKEKMSKIVDGMEELQKKNMELGESSTPPCPPLLTATLQKDKEVRDEKNQQHA